MKGSFAFSLGAFISASSFPLSIPYIIALGKYASLHLGMHAALGNILLYNIGYALPMLVVLLLYLYARERTDNFSDTLHEKTRVLNVHLTTWAWAGVGIFSMIDALCYFLMGQALVKGRYF
jgi:cytochrome c biogenesis protein CcdA